MKWLIASDIHGSYYYTKKLIEAYKREQADKLVLLGDILYHGPRNPLPEEYAPMEVAKALNSMKENILMVKGNCDSDVDQMVLEFPIMAQYALLPIGKRMVFITHGDKFNNCELPMLNKNDILLHGHTHVSVCEELETHTYMNPGSISLPKDDIHGYMVLTDNIFEWKTIEGETYRSFEV